MTHTITPVKTREEFDLDVDDRRTDDAGLYEGWYCVATDPWPCPALGCRFVARHMTAAHLILVWEEMDHPALLKHARRAQEVGRNPRVVEYETGMGPAIDYHEWERLGQPIHGMRQP